ncbi:MAG: peptidoglycan -binding protein [Pseudomonadota bacterium]
MAFHRRAGARFQGTIWPGFVDAITALLMVMIFVLTIFMVVQYVLNEEISNQDDELNALSAQLNDLADTLGLARTENARLEDRVATLSTDLTVAQRLNDSQTELIAQIGTQLDAQAVRIADFEAQVASLLAANQSLTEERDTTQAALDEQISEAEALSLALAQARDEVNAAAEAARRDAAERQALEALISDLETEAAAQDATLAQTLAALAEEEATSQTLQADAEALEAELSEAEAARLAELAAAEALRTRLADVETALSAEEQARLTEAAAAEALRARLQDSQAELTAMALALEEQRREAENTLTLLAAARNAEDDLARQLAAALAARAGDAASAESLQNALDAAEARIAALQADGVDITAQMDALELALAEALAAQATAEADLAAELTEAERQAALLAQAEDALSTAEAETAEGLRTLEALNQQIAALRAQLGELQGLLDQAAEQDAASDLQIENLGSELNAALARAALAERARAELEAAEAQRLAEEAARLEAAAARLEEENTGLLQDAEELAEARSEFFAALRELLEGREGVRIVGDRFVFSSEVLFATGAAELEPEGQEQIAAVARQLLEISEQIPEGVDWVLRVDGHTDNVGAPQSNWELSQARALSVVLFLIDEFDFPPERLAANGFGEYQPVQTGDGDAALAANRRIELKLTER